MVNEAPGSGELPFSDKRWSSLFAPYKPRFAPRSRRAGISRKNDRNRRVWGCARPANVARSDCGGLTTPISLPSAASAPASGPVSAPYPSNPVIPRLGPRLATPYPSILVQKLPISCTLRVLAPAGGHGASRWMLRQQVGLAPAGGPGARGWMRRQQVDAAPACRHGDRIVGFWGRKRGCPRLRPMVAEMESFWECLALAITGHR